jgi:hypothetical protein
VGIDSAGVVVPSGIAVFKAEWGIRLFFDLNLIVAKAAR